MSLGEVIVFIVLVGAVFLVAREIDRPTHRQMLARRLNDPTRLYASPDGIGDWEVCRNGSVVRRGFITKLEAERWIEDEEAGIAT